MFGMAIHMEVEYSKRFEQQGEGGNEITTGERGGGDREAPPPPLPPKADVSWAHILAQNQVRCSGGERRGGGCSYSSACAVLFCIEKCTRSYFTIFGTD